MKPAQSLIVCAHGGSALALIYAIPRHLSDASWPAHAKNHVLQALFWVVGFHLVAITLAWIPLSRGERWAWWASLGASLSIFGGYFAAIAVTGGGAPGPADDVFFATLFFANLIGLYLARAPERAS